MDDDTSVTGVSRFEDSQEKETLSYRSIKFSGLSGSLLLSPSCRGTQTWAHLLHLLHLPWLPAAQPCDSAGTLKFSSDGGSEKLGGKRSHRGPLPDEGWPETLL